MDIEEIRRTVIVAVFSDDVLFDLLVLKGGNAISLIYGYGKRSSLDIDFSIEDEFADVEDVKQRIHRALTDRFDAAGYTVFDYNFRQRPRADNEHHQENWGGYRAEFKIIEREKYLRFESNIDAVRRNAAIVGPAEMRTFIIDISKGEYCRSKTEAELKNYTIYVYTEAMLVIEKLRAVCQQMPDYASRTNKTMRARDFYDIWLIITSGSVNLSTRENVILAEEIFAAKKVPLELLEKLSEFREFHRPDWAAVENSVDGPLQSFDFYFDFVFSECKKLLES